MRGGRSGNTQRAVGKDGAGFDGVRRMLAVAEKQAKTIEITSQIVPCLILWLSEVLLVFLWFTGGRRARNKGTLERRLEENFLHAQQVWTEQAPVIKPGCELECFTRDPAVFTPEGLIPESCPPLGRFQRSPGVADGKTGVPAGDEGWVQADWKPYIVAVSVLDTNYSKYESKLNPSQPKRKITIWCWICHLCNRSGMTMYTMECPQCSHQRCVNCSTYKQSR